MAAADVQLQPGTPGSWPGCAPSLTHRSVSQLYMHTLAPASRLASTSAIPAPSSAHHTSPHRSADAKGQPATMTHTKAVPQPLQTRNQMPQQAALAQHGPHQHAHHAGIIAAGRPDDNASENAHGAAAPDASAHASPAESHSEPTGWAMLQDDTADDLDSAIFELTKGVSLASMPDSYTLPDLGAQPEEATTPGTTGGSADPPLEHIFDSVGLDDKARNGPAYVHPPRDGAAAGSDEPVQHSSADEPQPHVLVRLDEHGNVLRQATEEDIILLAQLLADQAQHLSGRADAPVASTRAPRKTNGVQKRTASTGVRKPGGPCCHCGAKGAHCTFTTHLVCKLKMPLSAPCCSDIRRHGLTHAETHGPPCCMIGRSVLVRHSMCAL